MKLKKAIRLIAIIAYLCIILRGEIIALPFGFWLLFSLFNFGDPDQLFAILAVAGLVTLYLNWNKGSASENFPVDILSFLLLASPIMRRLTAVPIELFNYSAFIIPTVLFIVLYITSLFLSNNVSIENVQE